MKKIILCFVAILFGITVFTIKNNTKALEKEKVIIIDPGHGGLDNGADRDGIVEDIINLNVALSLRTLLEETGYKVILTRDADYDLASDDATNRKREDLNKRVDLINDNNTTLFVSLHCNAIHSETWRGSQVFYSEKNDENKNFAKIMQNSLTTYLGNTERVEKEKTNAFILNETNQIGILVEMGFLSNNEERNLLNNLNYQQALSTSIFKGIIEYIK